MYRALTACATVALAFLVVPGLVAQPRDTIKLGEKFEGEIKGPAFRNGQFRYRTEIPVVLKAGQGIAISVTVVGKGRALCVRLYDPNGLTIGGSDYKVKTAQFTHEEVPSSGKYKIEVVSDLVGPFTLRATVPGDASEVKALEKRVEQLRRELEDAERKLRSLKAAGSSQLKNAIEKK